MKTCVVIAQDADRITATIPDVYTVLPPEQIASADLIIMDINGEAVWLTRLRPLAAIANDLDDTVAQYLRTHGILETGDLPRLNLDELAAAVTPRALQRFVRDLSRSGRYPDATRLQEFIVRRGIFV